MEPFQVGVEDWEQYTERLEQFDDDEKRFDLLQQNANKEISVTGETKHSVKNALYPGKDDLQNTMNTQTNFV